MKGLLTEEYGQLVKGLRRRPLTAKTRVRFPYWLLSFLGWFPRFTISLYIYRSVFAVFVQTEIKYGQLVKGLRRRPLTAKTRVRFPYWLLQITRDFLWLFFFRKTDSLWSIR